MEHINKQVRAYRRFTYVLKSKYGGLIEVWVYLLSGYVNLMRGDLTMLTEMRFLLI